MICCLDYVLSLSSEDSDGKVALDYKMWQKLKPKENFSLAV